MVGLATSRCAARPPLWAPRASRQPLCRSTAALRNTAVDEVKFAFSEVVNGFDLSDLELVRDGGGIVLAGAATLSTSGHAIWTLGGLADVTGISGHYTLRLSGAGASGPEPVQSQRGHLPRR